MEPYLPLLLAPFVGLLLDRVVVAAASGEGRSSPPPDGHRRPLPDGFRSSLPTRIGMAGAATVVALCALLATPDLLDAWANCLLGWCLLALARIDIRHFRLPDALTLPLLLLGLAAAWLLEPWLLTDRAIGAIAGYAALRLVGWAYVAWRGQEGLGQGDAKLLAAGGAWVGSENLSWVVLLAALAGIAWVGLSAVRGARVTGRTRVPFGPFLALGIWVVRMTQGRF